LHHEGKNVLLVGGLRGATRIEPMPGEIARNRRFPDGLLRVFLQGPADPHFVLAEIASFPERRARQQALDDLALAYAALGQLSDLQMLVRRPKGKSCIGGEHEAHGKLGLSSLQARWKTIELWTLPAEQYLAEGDASIVPWVPLMQFVGPAENLLERCAEKFRREAPPEERDDLLVVSQVMTRLLFFRIRGC
jgi:hypothetical protein